MEAKYMIGSQINKLVLQALETGDKYGLEIIKEIEDFTNGQVVLKQPSLYSALQRLEKKGIISSFWQDSDIGGRRHYYSLTNYGKNELEKSKKLSQNFELNQPQAQEQQIEKRHEITQSIEPEPQIQEIVIEEKEEPKTPTKVFEQYDPKNEKSEQLGKSFSQKMREYSEPDTSIFESPTPLKKEVEVKQVPTETPIHSEKIYYANEESQTQNIEPVKSSKNDINYKDILGDLDADLPESNEIKPTQNIFTEQQPTQVEQVVEKPKRTQTEYSKQIAQILRSNTKIKEERKSIHELNSKQNRDLMEEINRRYNLNGNYKKTTDEQKANKIATSTVGYTHIKQDNITVKPYSKTDDKICGTKNFLDINKFNLCRAGILTIIFMIELIVSYFCLKEQGMIYQPHAFLYIFYGVLAFVYLGVMMLFTFKDLGKKVRLKDINWWSNLFYRFILTVVLVTFVLAICLCIGMQKPLEIEFFTLWYIPVLAIANIFVSWIVGIILYSTKAFRV